MQYHKYLFEKKKQKNYFGIESMYIQSYFLLDWVFIRHASHFDKYGTTKS